MEHCEDVLAGVYNIPMEFTKPPVILDVGANVGAFAMWAVERWPGCKVRGFEPVPENAEKARALSLHQTFTQAGVRGCLGQMQIRPGKNNCGEWSCRADLGEQEGEPIVVPCIDAAHLPQAHILKLDTEGCELEILRRLWEVGRSNEFFAILLEWHSEKDRLAIDQLVSETYQLVGAHCHMSHRGVAKYALKSLVRPIA
jgi:FkbM family methyltransferase